MDFFFDCIKNSVLTVKKRVLCVALFFIMFVVGIMCGVIIKQSQEIVDFYITNCEKYVKGIFFGGVGGIIVDCLISFLVYVLLSLPAICCIWFIWLQGIFLFYKGFVCGILVELLFSLYGLSGGLVFFVVFLPQTIIFAVGYISFYSCVFDCSASSKGLGFLERIKAFYPYLIAYFIYSLFTLLFDLVSILLVFRIVFRLI